MNDPGGVFGASQLHEAPAQGESLEIVSFHLTRRHITLGGLLSKAKPPQAESERNHMFHWTGRSITLGGVFRVFDVCRGAFGSFCRALVVAHTANVETRSSPFAKHTRRIVCTLRIDILCLDLFVSH